MVTQQINKLTTYIQWCIAVGGTIVDSLCTCDACEFSADGAFVVSTMYSADGLDLSLQIEVLEPVVDEELREQLLSPRGVQRAGFAIMACSGVHEPF